MPRTPVKGCGMGPWLVLVSPCFRENVVATYKIGSFLCSLDNLLQKNVIVFFYGNQISKWRSFKNKRLFLTYFSHFLVTREKLQKISSTSLLFLCLCFLKICTKSNSKISALRHHQRMAERIT